MAKVTLLNKRTGPFHLAPLAKGGKKRVFAGGTTIVVDEAEAAQLMKYKDIVALKDGAQVSGPVGSAPVPAGAGVAGRAAPPAEPTGPGAAKK